MSNITYKVIAETTEYRQCDVCGGVGHKVKAFKGEKYTSPCFMCAGSGRRAIIHRTEVSLAQALQALELQRNSEPI